MNNKRLKDPRCLFHRTLYDETCFECEALWLMANHDENLNPYRVKVHSNTNELNAVGVAEYLYSKKEHTNMTGENLLKVYLDILEEHNKLVLAGIQFTTQRLTEIEGYKTRVLEIQEEIRLENEFKK